MAWDSETHRCLTLAKLKFASPDRVYEALREYAEHLGPVPWFMADEELEETLLARNNPLIDLALARYGASENVLGTLYSRGLRGSGDPLYDKGLRLGCLANMALRPLLTGSNFFGVESKSEELRRLARDGDEDEIAVLMGNPAAGPILGLAYGRKPPFDLLDSNRLCEFVTASINNPRININQDSEDGPDLVAHDIHTGIYELLRSAPLEREWLYPLHDLLLRVDPQAVRIPGTDPREVLSRWQGLRLEKGFGEDVREEEDGRLTSLSLVDEFRCLVGALYGRRLDAKQGIISIGGPDDPDIALRCAYYGNATLTRNEMETGHERDGKAFTLAALSNLRLYDKPDLRAALEEMAWGKLRYVYVQRCGQIHQRWPNFDPRPVSESGRDVLDDVIESRPTEEMTALSRIASQVAELQKGLGRVHSVAVWGLLAVFAAIIFFNR